MSSRYQGFPERARNRNRIHTFGPKSIYPPEERREDCESEYYDMEQQVLREVIEDYMTMVNCILKKFKNTLE